MTRRRAALFLALLLSLLAAGPARAATFTVNQHDDVIGNTGCPGICTLRAALSAASSNNNEDDVVVLDAGSYTVNSQLGPLAVPTNATRITLRGAGANATTIEPLTAAAIRVLAVGTGAGVTLNDLTLRGGSVTTGMGGNLWVQSGATVNLNRVRVTGGSAPQGGGVAVQAATGGATLTVSQSLIDTNNASGTALTAAGGGLYIEGSTGANTVTIQDSTITANSARNGAGIAVTNNATLPPILRGVTLAGNNARAGTPTGIGGIYSASATVRFQGSIIAGNTTTINLGPGPVQAPANCSITPAATDDGGNLETATDCGLAGHQNTDPLLAAALDSSQPPALAIPANSPAVNIAACGTRTLDQRGVTRPQGVACDAGAYEYQAPPPEPTPTPTATPVVTATPTPTPTATPTPVRNKSVVAKPLSGTVLIKVPGAKKFSRLDLSLVKNGAEVDTRKGIVEITQAGGGVSKFFDGIFKISQSGGITTLTLTEKLDCKASGKKPSAAAKKPKTRKLWGDGKGKFRTRGQYSAATVRGTRWLVQDTCTSTTTRVTQGSVLVRDLVKKKNVIVRKGKRYTARAKR